MAALQPSSGADLQFDVLVAGGGFTAVYCAQALARQLGDEAAKRVALVADQNFMVFQPMLAEVAGSALAPRHVVNPIRRLCRGVATFRGKITAIDLAARCLTVAAGDFSENSQIRFGHLVLAVGGIVDLSRVAGMAEHAYLMKNVGDALALRAAVIDRFEEANLETDPERQRQLLTFAIVGGGYSGVETAGQILDLAKQMAPSYSTTLCAAWRVVLVHSGAHLLPEIGESLGRYTEENLRSRGVELLLNARVTAVTASRLALNTGQIIATHTVVSTVGGAPNPLITSLCRDAAIENEKGRIIVDPFLRVPGHDRLWAAGDCAAVPMERASSDGDETRSPVKKMMPSPYEPRPYCPPTAQFAVRQGTVMGKNIACVLRGDPHLKPFTFTGLGELAAIGHQAAVAEIFGYQFHGFIAWWMWRTIYLMKLPGLERKLRVLIDWTLDLFFPRDIALFLPHPTNLLEEVHLEKGDIAIHHGEPARSLYIVKSGAMELQSAEGAVLRQIKQGDQIGRKTLLESKLWRFTAVAVEPTTLVCVSGVVFETVARAGCSVDEVFGKPGENTPAAPVAPPAATTAPAPAEPSASPADASVPKKKSTKSAKGAKSTKGD